MKPFYITTAIDYANGSPHLGHAYEKVLADVIARTQRLTGRQVHFLTGLDEHGTKVQQAARMAGVEPQALCDTVVVEFQNLLRTLHITNDDYIRTTEPRHKEGVRRLLQKLFDQGDIFLGEYRGFYSARQEQFLQEKDKVDGKWSEIFGEVVEVVEPNYFFPLEPHRHWLADFLQKNPDWIFPKHRQKQVEEFLKNPLNDLCISRPVERLGWGIPLPFDEKYVTYVWFDALVNYISAAGYGTAKFGEPWPADIHIIGKDILVPAHAVYWPIMLKVAGLPLPRHLLVHGFWTSGGKKESKSDIEKAKAEGQKRENPLDMLAQYGADPFRYFVMREMALGEDSEFTAEQFTARYNSELADDFGNLVARLLNMGARYSGGWVPKCVSPFDADALAEDWNTNICLRIENLGKALNGDLGDGLLDGGFSGVLTRINAFAKTLNAYVEHCAPWRLAKLTDEKSRDSLETCLAVVAEGVRVVATAYQPIMPDISARILALIDREKQHQPSTWSNALKWDVNYPLTGAQLGEKVILFPKIVSEPKLV